MQSQNISEDRVPYHFLGWKTFQIFQPFGPYQFVYLLPSTPRAEAEHILVHET